MSKERLKILFNKYYNQNASEEEVTELQHLLAEVNDPSLLWELNIASWNHLHHPDPEFAKTDQDAIRRILSTVVDQEKTETQVVPSVGRSVHRVHFLRRGWSRYAAAVLILICGVGGYFLIHNKKTDRSLVGGGSLQTDILPGGDRAFLTLADGRVILLDSVANGNLAQQGNAEVIKLSDGQIAYNLKGSAEGDVMMNTMTTPKGGQYQLTLPDGSKIWLNAASSIEFPAAFAGSERKVKITGEAYFEVAKNKQKPFIVDVDGKSLIEVLGTSFNVNSYRNEGAIKTTLVEGSIKVGANNQIAVLQPGQQATLALSADRQLHGKSSMIQIQAANIDQVIAWKNGLFNFEGADVYAVMRQFERWYDIKVQYEGAISNIRFDGEMFRKESLAFNLESLRELGVKFRLDGKTLIVY